MRASWEKSIIEIDGYPVEAISPVILSASRATDLPAFHFEDFLQTLAKGHTYWKNPFSGKTQALTFEKCALIVFWSKYPLTLLQFDPGRYFSHYVDTLIHYTCNDYESEGYESKLPPLRERIDLFRLLHAKYGKKSLLWRFDPLFLSDKIKVDELCQRLHRLVETIAPFVSRMIFSFIEIESYIRVKRRLKNFDTSVRVPELDEKIQIISVLSDIAVQYGLEVSPCATDVSFSDHSKLTEKACIDYYELRENFQDNRLLQSYLSTFGTEASNYRHIGQRKRCNCTLSKDIGTYGTCAFDCTYCYARK